LLDRKRNTLSSILPGLLDSAFLVDLIPPAYSIASPLTFVAGYQPSGFGKYSSLSMVKVMAS
jgi:hypothetical protein